MTERARRAGQVFLRVGVENVRISVVARPTGLLDQALDRTAAQGPDEGVTDGFEGWLRDRPAGVRSWCTGSHVPGQDRGA